MSPAIPYQLPNWIKYFHTIESTNNYAMQLIGDGMAQPGLVIWAKHQNKGKGQRGKRWKDYSGNLTFSLIVAPSAFVSHPFQLSMLTAIILCRYLSIILPKKASIAIKWPNDIYINDKKACGLLIENTYRGAKWTHSVIGIGLNTNQKKGSITLPKATSLAAIADKEFDLLDIITDLRQGILNAMQSGPSQDQNNLLKKYNKQLYKKDEIVNFEDKETEKQFEAEVLEVNSDGTLKLLLPDGKQQEFGFGQLKWLL